MNATTKGNTMNTTTKQIGDTNTFSVYVNGDWAGNFDGEYHGMWQMWLTSGQVHGFATSREDAITRLAAIATR